MNFDIKYLLTLQTDTIHSNFIARQAALSPLRRYVLVGILVQRKVSCKKKFVIR